MTGLVALWMSVAVAAGPSAKAAPPQPVYTGIDPPAMAELLREMGDTVTVGKGSSGDTRLEGDHDGVRYEVLFYECDQGQQCKLVQLRATYAIEGARSSTVNPFNREQLFGRAYVNADRHPVFEDLVRLTGGVTWDHLRKRRDVFYTGLKRFEKHLADAVQ
jgi:hypothetical protein